MIGQGQKSAGASLSRIKVIVVRDTERRVMITGNFLRVLEADQSFDIKFDDGPFMDAGKGIAWQFDIDGDGNAISYKSVTFRAPVDLDLTATILHGFGRVSDNRVNFVAGSSVLDVRETAQPRRKPLTVAGHSEHVINGGATAAIAAVAVNYREVIIQNAGVEQVKVRESGGTAGQGITLDPGERLTIPCAAALEAQNLNPTPANVAVVNVFTSEETA